MKVVSGFVLVVGVGGMFVLLWIGDVRWLGVF